MFWIKIIKKLVAILHSEISPRQIAAGFALGAFMGLPPSNIVNNLAVFFVIMLFNVNVAAAFLGAACFGLVSFFLDPVADAVGYILLVKTGFLSSFWAKMYNAPVVPFTRFYNTVMLGSFALAAAVFLPALVLAERFVVYYRKNLQSKVQNWKIMKALKLTKVYSFYDNLQN